MPAIGFQRFAGLATVMVKPPRPKGWRARLPPKDEKAVAAGRRKTAIEAAGVAIGIEYEDSNGDLSERRITIRRVYRDNGELYLSAWCHERQAPRLFKASQVLSVTDLSTGERHEDPATFFSQQLAGPLVALMTQSPVRPIRAPAKRTATPHRNIETLDVAVTVADGLQPLLDTLKVELATIVYICRVDGMMHAAERAVAVDFATGYLPDLHAHRSWLDWYVGALYPDVEIMNELAAKANRLPYGARCTVLQTARAIIEADGVRSKSEELVLNEIEAMLRR